MRARVVDAVFGEPLAEAGGQAARQCDHAFGVALEVLEADGGTSARHPVDEARGAELHQVAVAGVIGGEQRQVVALTAPAGHFLAGEVDLAAENRLDAVTLGGLVHLDRAAHHAVVGERERRLAEGRGALGKGVDVACPVEQRVLGVDVQMDAGLVAHGP